jgi:hypothetical protein
LRSYDSAPLPPPFALSHKQVASPSQSSCVSPVEGEERGGRAAKSYDHENAWPSINYSILSDAAVHYGLPDNILTKAFIFFGKSFHLDPNNNEVKN